MSRIKKAFLFIVLTLLLVAFYSPQAHADTAVPLLTSSDMMVASNGANTSVLIDGNLATYLGQITVTATFQTGQKVATMLIETSSGTGGVFGVSFYNSAGTLVRSANFGTSKSPIKPGSGGDGSISDVKTVTFRVANGSVNNIAEIQLYGVPDTTPPSAPTGLIGTAGDKEVVLNWNANTESDLAGYMVYIDGSNWGSVTGTTATISDLINGVEHSFYVVAKDVSGNLSPKSNVVNLAAVEPPPPENPKGLKGVGGDGAVNLSWEANSEADLDYYTVYMDGIYWGQSKTTTAIIDSLVNGVNHQFYVTATNKRGIESGESNVVTLSAVGPPPPDTTPPETPKDFKAAVSSDRKKIVTSWTENTEPDLDGYKLFKSEDGLSYMQIGGLIKGTVFDAVQDPVEGKTYYFKLKSVDLWGNESNPATAQVKVTARTTDSDQTGNSEYLLVTWTETEGAIGYNIYLNGRQVAQVGPDPPYEFKITKAMGYYPGALTNKAYVKARFADGSEGESGNTGGTGGSGDYNLSFIGVIPMIKTAIAFLGIYKFWILLALAVVFSPVLYQLVMRLIHYAASKNKVRG